MSTSSHTHRSGSQLSSHSTRYSNDKQTKCGRSTYYTLRSHSCSRSHRSKEGKGHHKNHDRSGNRGRDRHHVRRTLNSHSRNSISRSRSRTQSYSKSLSPGDRRRGYHHRYGRSRSRTSSERSYCSSRSRSRSSYHSTFGRHSSRSYHRRNRYWSRSNSYSRDRDRYFNRLPGVYHPPYPTYSGRGPPPPPIAMIPMHPANRNPGYRGYSNPHGPYGAQYGGAGSYHSHHRNTPSHVSNTHGHYGGVVSRDRDKGPPQLHKRRHDGPPGVSLLIRHVAPTISTHHLFQVFTQKLPHLPPPRDIYIPRDFHSHQPKGFAFVEYTSFEQAQEARCEIDKMVLHGREIEVIFAQDKRKTPSQMRDRHLDDAYGGGDINTFSHGNESSSSFEKHKRKERQKERSEHSDKEKNSKVISPLRSK